MVKSPASARARAQAAYAIAAAIATALVTAGAVTDFQKQQWWVQALGLLTVAGWMATALIFMLAVGVGVRALRAGTREPAARFVDDVIENVQHEVDNVNHSIFCGWITACVASGLTLLTLALAFSVPKDNTDEAKGTVALAGPASKGVAKLCQDHNAVAPATVNGMIDTASLKNPLIKLKVDSVACPKAAPQGKTASLRLPAAQITGISIPPDEGK